MGKAPSGLRHSVHAVSFVSVTSSSPNSFLSLKTELKFISSGSLQYPLSRSGAHLLSFHIPWASLAGAVLTLVKLSAYLTVSNEYLQ